MEENAQEDQYILKCRYVKPHENYSRSISASGGNVLFYTLPDFKHLFVFISRMCSNNLATLLMLIV